MTNLTSLCLSNLQANFVYKRARGNGFFLVTEQDGSDYYHINFLAQDKNEHSQLFFGEIKVHVAPREEDVTCCCPCFAFRSRYIVCAGPNNSYSLIWQYGLIFMVSLIIFVPSVSCCCGLLMVTR